MGLGSCEAGLQEDVVGTLFVRPGPGRCQEAGADTPGTPPGVHGEILDRRPTAEAHRKDVHVDAGHADELALLRSRFEERDVVVGEYLRGALDGAVAVPISGTATGRGEKPLQPRDELGLGTPL